MAHLDGYAFKTDWEKKRDERMARFQEMQKLWPDLCIIKTQAVKYTRHEYSGEIPPGIELSDLDIMLICDDGNACFGGTVDRSGRTFRCTIYTD